MMEVFIHQICISHPKLLQININMHWNVIISENKVLNKQFFQKDHFYVSAIYACPHILYQNI